MRRGREAGMPHVQPRRFLNAAQRVEATSSEVTSLPVRHIWGMERTAVHVVPASDVRGAAPTGSVEATSRTAPAPAQKARCPVGTTHPQHEGGWSRANQPAQMAKKAQSSQGRGGAWVRRVGCNVSLFLLLHPWLAISNAATLYDLSFALPLSHYFYILFLSYSHVLTLYIYLGLYILLPIFLY